MTPRPEPGDAFNQPLDNDLLIQASAGTGKTYALTTLVARLIVEERLDIDRLLIVTFTISAASELRTRVRRLLQAARRAASGAEVDADSQAGRLRQGWLRHDIEDADALRLLTRAVRDLDRANITTIHGFCQRTLVEFALHAGTPFSFEVSGDDAMAVGDAARDFWRRRMVGEPVPLLEYAKSKKFVQNEDTTNWLVGHHSRVQDIRGVCSPEELPHVLEEKRGAWLEALRDSQVEWSDPAQRAAFLEVANPARWRLKKQRERVNVLARTLIEAFDAGAAEELSPDYATAFGTSALNKGLKNPAPLVPLFASLERAGEAGSEYGSFWLASQRRGLIEDAGESLHHATRVDRSLSFDALLVELHRALDGERGPGLAHRIRNRYPVALIDEFQDTDRLQARIFETIYPGKAEADDGRLFVVGDPKQSIYRFRGSDVFAYLEARNRLGASDQPLELGHNYRSTPGLIRAVNRLFSRERPFVLPDFGFSPATPSNRPGAELVVEDDRDDAASFQLVLIPGANGKRHTKAALTPRAAKLVAHEIARLVTLGKEGMAKLVGGDRPGPLAARDIAVLVRKGAQGKAVAEALRRLGIDSVEMGTDNVFQSDEAGSLHRLLHALCLDESEYNATQLLRGALAADLFGLDMEELGALRDDDDAWNDWRGLAREWAEVWQEHGIATLMRRILFAGERTDCSANLLAYPNGPRRLTNYLHLTDLLHEAETRRRPSRQGLLDWFRQARTDARTNDETAQLRLESDENLVKIVTAHRAKGLEFPVVFYPFAWDGRRPPSGGQRKPTADYYDPTRKKPVLHLRPSDDDYDRERVEDHADELRLLYVALTRAEHRCVVTWAPANEAEHAPLGWLLHGRRTTVQDDTAEALKENADRIKALGPGEWLGEVQAFANEAPGAISVRVIDEATADAEAESTDAEAVKPLEDRKLERKLERIRQRTSYSALSAGGGAAVFVRDNDEVDLSDDGEAVVQEEAPAGAPDLEEDGPTVFTFPSGGRSGRCLHEIFERRLGDPDAGSLERTCEAALARYGFQDKWLPVVRTLVEKGLETPLSRPGDTGGVFRLSDLERPIAEMEFHLPLHKLQRAELAHCLKEHGYEHRLAGGDARIDGFLHGFIDLVAEHDGRWYVLDYKSNWLGPDLASYSEAAIAESMRHHGYHLQYLLYLTALHRLLRLRLADYDYDHHIGGAFYLFLRGMRPNAPGSGVFHDRPSRTCIEAIDACFGEAP